MHHTLGTHFLYCCIIL